MTWTERLQRAVDYIEAHITEDLDYTIIAKEAYSSSYHFQRMFGTICGITLGEYIRRRRLTLAAEELTHGARVTEVAFRYGYGSVESFSRAFMRFHGVTPTRIATADSLQSFSPLVLKTESRTTTDGLHFCVEKLDALTLVGYKKRFHGVPFGAERAEQERAFYQSTRAKQWLLLGASCEYSTDYCVVTDVDDTGYDFWIAYNLDAPTREDLFDPRVTGVADIGGWGLQTLTVPAGEFAVFQTEKCKRSIDAYIALRELLATDAIDGYTFCDAPEVVVMRWRPQGEWAKERFIEIRLPVRRSL